MIVAEALAKSYQQPDGSPLPVLRDVSLTVGTGEIVAVIGRSGSGKSTLLNILGLLDRSDVGRYTIDGDDVAMLSDAALSRLRGGMFGFVFQQFQLLSRQTATENVAAPLLHADRMAIRSRRGRAQEVLSAVGLSDRLDTPVEHLSGGEQQRVAIARALVRLPRFVLADEPTGSLDVATGELVLDLLVQLVREQGAGMIIVTHDERVAERADRRCEMRSGQLRVAMEGQA